MQASAKSRAKSRQCKRTFRVVFWQEFCETFVDDESCNFFFYFYPLWRQLKKKHKKHYFFERKEENRVCLKLNILQL
jgi:hypothetical protein